MLITIDNVRKRVMLVLRNLIVMLNHCHKHCARAFNKAAVPIKRASLSTIMFNYEYMPWDDGDKGTSIIFLTVNNYCFLTRLKSSLSLIKVSNAPMVEYTLRHLK